MVQNLNLKKKDESYKASFYCINVQSESVLYIPTTTNVGTLKNLYEKERSFFFHS